MRIIIFHHFDQFWAEILKMCHRRVTDGDMRLEESESPSKIIRVQTLRSEFGLHLTYENLGQRVTRSVYLGHSLCEGEGVRSTLLQGHMNWREESCLVHENYDV